MRMYSDILILAVYIVAWLAVFGFQFKRNRKSLGPANMIFLFYAIFSGISLALLCSYYFSANGSGLKIFPLVYLFVLLLVGAAPVIKFENAKVRTITRPNEKLFTIFLWFFIGVSLIRIPAIFSSLSDGLVTLLISDQGGSDLYLETRSNAVASDNHVSNLIAIFYNFFSDFGIFLFYYYLTRKKRKKILSIFLLFALLVRLVAPLASGQRTDTVLSLLTIIISYFIFRPFMETGVRRKIRNALIIMGIIVALPFMALTLSRFGDSSNGVLGGMMDYAGQSTLNFQQCLESNMTRHGDRTCAEFKRLLGFQDVPVDIDSRRLKYANLPIDDYYFYTYVGDFVLDFGPLATVFILCFFAALFCSMIKVRSHKISFHNLLIVYFVCSICVPGYLYLFPYSHMANFQIITIFLVYFTFRFFEHRKLVIRSKKKKTASAPVLDKLYG